MKPEDTIQLSRSRGGASNTSLEAWAPTFDDLVSELTRPTVGPKDGSYFVRGPFNGVAKRADEHIVEANVVILDADKRVNVDTGEILDGAPHPALVHEALRDLDVPHAIYTSHSHGGEKGNRYRVVVPAALGSDRRVLLATVDHLVDTITKAGVPLANAKENYAWAQAWYLPRIRSIRAEFLHFAYDTDTSLDLETILDEWKRSQPPGIDTATVVSDRPKGGSGLIGKYVAEHGDPAQITEAMTRRGYLLRRSAMLNGTTAYRFLAPGSTSGTPGVVLFRAKDGTWRVVSFHGDHDKLGERDKETGKPLAHDAFDLYRIFDHGGDLKQALRAIDPRPVIKVYGGGLVQQTQRAIRALGKQDPPRVFQRGSMLVRVAHLADISSTHGVVIPKGSATLMRMDNSSLRLQMADAAIWQAAKKRGEGIEWVDVDPPGDVVGNVLSSAGDWHPLPVLAGIAEAPILLPDGSIHDQRGYDPKTRLYCEGHAPRIKPVAVEHLTLENARAAADYLLKPFAEFPFASPDLDRSVVLAYLLTLALRPTLPLAPLFAFSATAPGTGKGLLAEVCNLIVRGRDAAIMSPPSGTNAEDEMRKRITALLIQGATSINLDNWDTAVGGNSLNALFTSAEWTDRVLGASQTVTLPTRVTWAVTGNNLIVRGDMVRRTLLASLDAGVERPELRQFGIRNLTQHVLENRELLLTAIYFILRAYRAAGEPEKDGATLGRFEEWSRTVAAPIRWLGMRDPIDSQERLRAEDPEASRLSALLSDWFALFGSRTMTTQDLLKELETVNQFGRGFPGGELGERRVALLEALEEAAADRAGRINPRKVGWYLRKFSGRVCDGDVLIKEGTTHRRTKFRVARTGSAAPAAPASTPAPAFVAKRKSREVRA